MKVTKSQIQSAKKQLKKYQNADMNIPTALLEIIKAVVIFLEAVSTLNKITPASFIFNRKLRKAAMVLIMSIVNAL